MTFSCSSIHLDVSYAPLPPQPELSGVDPESLRHSRLQPPAARQEPASKQTQNLAACRFLCHLSKRHEELVRLFQKSGESGFHWQRKGDSLHTLGLGPRVTRA